MVVFRWTKFQDFYLRLGLLKVLVGVLGAHRRSSAVDDLLRRMDRPLFTPAKEHGELWARLPEGFPWHRGVKTQGAGLKTREPSVAEALLELGDCPSALLAVTGPTAYKIVDWGRDVGFIGEGQQITEKGLLLRAFLPEGPVNEFLGGNPLAWNPFVLSSAERLFLLHHLFEVDELTILILDTLAARGSSEPIEMSEASSLVCRAFFKLLGSVEGRVAPRELPLLLRAKRLAAAMASDLSLADEDLSTYSHLLRTQPPKAVKVTRTSGRHRKTTKNADHQTVPRFEQLADLGFVDKSSSAVGSCAERHAARSHWRWTPTMAVSAWGECRRDQAGDRQPWEWYGFSQLAIRAGMAPPSGPKMSVTTTGLLQYVSRAYERVRRPVGHTPLYSVALMAMLAATSDGVVVEMKTVHDLMVAIKTEELLPDHASFASGNELDRMFIFLKPGFVDVAVAAIRRREASDSLSRILLPGVER